MFNKNIFHLSLFFLIKACLCSKPCVVRRLVDFDPAPCRRTLPPQEIPAQTRSPRTLTTKPFLLSIHITRANCSEFFSRGFHSIVDETSPFISTFTLRYSSVRFKHEMRIIHLLFDSCILPAELGAPSTPWSRMRE